MIGKPLKAPFPWFGGKSRAAALVWERFGNVRNYVEPFAGSLAVLLARPHAPGLENDLSAQVREWAIANGDNPMLRVALCGYDGEHEMPRTWRQVSWKPNGGYANQRGDTKGKRAFRERMWFSPYCLEP